MKNEIILSPASALQPAPLFRPTQKAAKRVLELFTAQINNNHTRKAYLNACAGSRNGATLAASARSPAYSPTNLRQARE